MSNFIQLHLLTSYPPSNLNRDDLGRPKTAIMGGKNRLRVSSQSLKRAWRTSSIFAESMKGHIGIRTKTMGLEIYEALKSKGVAENNAKEWAKQIAEVFGKAKKTNAAKPLEELEIEQLAHFSPEEKKGIDVLVDKLATTKTAPSSDDLKLLKESHTAADIAMFGRMLASSPAFNTEAAVQVAHAITVHDVAVEDDYFTAVDDLNKGDEDMGAAHIGETEFGAGVFYLYICINRDLLQENIGGKVLADKAMGALVEAAAKVSPNGKQNSFASRAYASYILAEKGEQQPRSLSVAFLKTIKGEDILSKAIEALERKRENMDAVYGKCAEAIKTMNAETGEGSLEEIITFVTE
ncbi:MAG: type I-E CRISPR-associated protein Cas7/Cse4/CasC [Syntrophales bacterium]|jgi:CRISPR system Cascade subunit CasC|nr:type I-E CRISPR-associated protein Cas7/Cse4/CasC [Syntrophales bacterium]MCK9528315.1 type I-E CRISPR-associated protein Cas7/Cse4/CasC [Syntrophales bacterium]MDX9922154.1 type I-E CRISPR-associated protein Cas7/Cse4/CasC [Syntrophales bacterium]